MNAVASRARRSAVEGSRGKTHGNASGFLDFARNDEDSNHFFINSSTAAVIATLPVRIVGSGTGANLLE